MAIVTNTIVTNNYDENGVIVSSTEEVRKTNYKNTKDEGEFIKVYFGNIRSLCSLPSTAVALLVELASRMSYANLNDNENYGGQVVAIRKDIRALICDELNIKERAFYNNIKKLIDEGFIKEVAKSTYQINPNIMGRGLYEFSPKFQYGGIKDLRENYYREEDAETSTEDEIQEIGLVEQEIERYEELYRNEKDNFLKKEMAKDIKELRKGLESLSEMNYTKTTKFTVKQKKMFDAKKKELYDKVEDLIDDAMSDIEE